MPHTGETKAKLRAKRSQQGPVWNAGIATGIVPWNKGLTTATSELVAEIGRKVGVAALGKERGPLPIEVRQKLSAGRMGDRNWVKRPEVRVKISRSMSQLYLDRPDILENRKRAGRNQFPGNFSSLERTIADALDQIGLPYLHNGKVGRYWPDFIVLGRVIIECDGDYWHKDTEKDRRRDAFLMDRGFFVFHLQESAILADPAECVRRVVRLYEPFSEMIL